MGALTRKNRSSIALFSPLSETQLTHSIGLLRRRKFPYRIVSALSILVGVIWFFQLPTDNQSRETYVSENALLPGQVHTYFGGTESMIFRAYLHEVEALENSTSEEYVLMTAGWERGRDGG